MDADAWAGWTRARREGAGGPPEAVDRAAAKRARNPTPAPA
jgi:hypothetical protein